MFPRQQLLHLQNAGVPYDFQLQYLFAWLVGKTESKLLFYSFLVMLLELRNTSLKCFTIDLAAIKWLMQH